MAINEPNKPGDTKTAPAKETPIDKQAAPAVKPLAPEGKGSGHIIVPFVKTDAPIAKMQDATKEPEKPAEPEVKAPAAKVALPTPEVKHPDKDPEPAKPALPNKPVKDEKPDKQPKPEKPPKADKPAKQEQAVPAKEQSAPISQHSPQPKEAPRTSEPEQIRYINLTELHTFKNHPFSIRDDAEMQSLVESVKTGGVNQPALVRPHPDGNGYEIIAGHRRQKASEMAGYFDMPCIVRNMTDDEAILAMTDDNLRQRSEILPSEKAQSLKMQVAAIKHQGTRDTSGQDVQNSNGGKWSIDVVGERNSMNGKQVQRYIRLTELVPDLIKAVDEKKLAFTPAVEISFIRPKNQNFIAVALESQQSSPSLSQAQRMRELDQKGLLNGDMIDGILCEQKKEVDKVIISGAELNKYFGKEKTPQEMKNQIIKLLDEWSTKQKELAPLQKKPQLEK